MPPCLPRAGFSFAEVMFAVVVLGIGFIMAAAIFPVAIKQGQLNTEETAAVAVARNGVNVMTGLATQLNPRDLAGEAPLLATTELPAPARPGVADYSYRYGSVFSVRDRRFDNLPASGTLATGVFPTVESRREGMWSAVMGNAIQPGDPRYAWVPLYRRDVVFQRSNGGTEAVRPFPFAQLILIGCVARSRPTLGPLDVTAPGTTSAQLVNFPQLEPKPIAVQVKPLPDGSGYYMHVYSVRALGAAGSGFNVSGPYAGIYDAVARDGVAEGSFVVISDDRIVDLSNGISRSSGRMNGRVYRLGVRQPELDASAGGITKYAWTLQPGYDFFPDPGENGEFDSSSAGPADDVNRLGDNGAQYDGLLVNGVQTYGGKLRFAGAGPTLGCVAYVVGRGYTEPTGTPGAPGSTAQYEGPTQDVAVYTTFVPAR